MSGFRIRKLVVVGVGLIGGSVALALRAQGRVTEVVGVGRTRTNLDAAIAAGIVDRAVTLDGPWTDELADADLVFVAAPVAQFPSLFRAMAASLGPATVVTDGGSTKQDVVSAGLEHLGAAWPRFVPAHPIAGSENSGAQAAYASLYEGRNAIMTPLPRSDADAVALVQAMWEACGARVVTLTPESHDRIFAAVSHFPHLLASLYVADLATRPDAPRLFDLAGTGFRDFTRIAAASPEMWRDITLANREALQDEIAAFRGMLDTVEASMRAGDARAIEGLFDAAGKARRAWGDGQAS